MRKIIITIITTIVLVAPFERLDARTYTIVHDWGGNRRYTFEFSSNVPTLNILTGAHGKISLGGIWRFYPFIQVAPYLQWREKNIRASQKGEYRGFFEWGYSVQRFWIGSRRYTEYHSPKRSLNTIFSALPKIGFEFRISNRNFIRASANIGSYFSAEYIRRKRVSQRLSIDLSAGFLSDNSRYSSRSKI